MKIKRRKYNLEDDSIVETFKLFPKDSEGEIYLAIVEMDGMYPSKGKIAKNSNRDEYFLVLKGEFTITVNDKVKKLKEGEGCLALDGQSYKTQGTGKLLVFLRDKDNGKSNIINK